MFGEFAGDLETKGREQALIYKTLVLTGLRRNEMATETDGKCDR